MKKGFVTTQNFKRLAEAQQAVERRGPKEAGLVIIRGPYGVGKSALVERFALDHDAVFVRCMETWTKRGLLDAVAKCMGLDTRGRNSEVQARIIGRQAVDMKPMIFDEADFLVRSTAALLECIRDITDTTGCACFLVGMETFGNRLVRYGHIASRVAKVVEFQPLTPADVQATCDKLCEVPLTPEVVAEVHRQSGGRMRLALAAISNIEQWAEANGWPSVAAEHIKGRPLCVEFKPEGGRRGVPL